MSYYDTIEWDIKRARELAADPNRNNNAVVVGELLLSLSNEIMELQQDVALLKGERLG